MKRFIIALLIVFSSTQLFAVQPRVWSFTGTATTSNATKTVGNAAPFNPASICITNDGATIDLYVNFLTGTAATTNDAGNIIIKPGEAKCFSFRSPNANDTFLIGFITASSTTTFRVDAVR